MSENVELRVNVLNQLALFRSSTFKDRLAFIDEDVQNAQRAKATEVRITTESTNRILRISNNGRALENPQSLFSVAESGWDDDVKENENPFGMGFFSNVSVSNLVEVRSGKWFIRFDVDKMLTSGDTRIATEEVGEEEFFDGFELTLYNFDYSDITRSSVRERAALLGKYVHEIDIYFDEVLQEKQDLTTPDGSTFALSIDDDNLKGWIALNRWYMHGLKIFYKGRLVKELESMPYLNGELHVSDRILTLTAPDRKDIVKDKKLTEFRELIKMYAEELANIALRSGKQRDIDEYADAIAQYTDASKLKDSMRFIMFHSKRTDDVRYLRDIIRAKSENPGMRAFSEYEAYLRENSQVQSESHFDEIETVEEDVVGAPMLSKSYGSGGGGYYSGSSRESEIISEDEKKEESGKTLMAVDRPKFWVAFSELNDFGRQVSMVKHYDLMLVLARNKFERSVLEDLEQQGVVIHVGKLEERIVVKSRLSNTELTGKEERGLMLLDMVSRMAGFDHNVFAIGDLLVERTLTLPEFNVEDTKIETNVIAIRNKEVNKIYLDRSAIRRSKIVASLSNVIHISDYKFLLANADHIISALALMGTNSKGDLYKELVSALADA